MVPVLVILALPAPVWSQFKEPVLTDLTANRGLEWGATFSSDMLEAYWIVSEGAGQWDVWEAHRESIDASWEDAAPLDIVNTNKTENSPHLSSDGLTLTFGSNGIEGGYGGSDLWQTTRENRNAPWKEPVNLGPTINTGRNEGHATLSADGLEIIFNAGCTGPCSPYTMRRSTRDTLADEWSTPEEMTPSGRGDEVGSAAHPSLSPDGLSLYFNKAGSFGDWDVFVSNRPSLEATFGPPENLGAPVNTSERETGVRVAPDGSLYFGRWSGSLRILRAEQESVTTLLGDFNANGVLDVDDIDDLLGRVDAGQNPTNYDLNNDGIVNTVDIGVWVKDLANTWIGDATLDGQFDSGDLVEVFKAGQYEDGIAGNSTWATGDWNGDREFDSGDLVASFQDNGFEKGTRQTVAAVPEPSTAVLLLTGLIAALRIRRRE